MVTKAQAIALQADLDTRGYRRPGGTIESSESFGMASVTGFCLVAIGTWLYATVTVFTMIGG